MWDDKSAAGLADAAHVHQGEQEQDAEADGERVLLKAPGSTEIERAHARRDADRGGEHIVDHEGGCSEQTRDRCRGSPTRQCKSRPVGICIDRLTVGEEDDDEQDDDRDRDGHDVVDAKQTKWDEEGQSCCLRPVCGGRKRVQPEDGQARMPDRRARRAAPSSREDARRVRRQETCGRPAFLSADCALESCLQDVHCVARAIASESASGARRLQGRSGCCDASSFRCRQRMTATTR